MLNKSGISAKKNGGDIKLNFNGNDIASAHRGLHNLYGLYVNGTKLFVDGDEIAKSSPSRVFVEEDGIYFGDVKLNSNGTCINITEENYNTLLSGGVVDGYKAYDQSAIYNIVSDVSTANTITYTESNGIITFSDSSTASEKRGAIHNNDGLLAENTLNTTATMTSSECPFVNVGYFEPVVAVGGKINLEYCVDSYEMPFYNTDTIGDTFTVVVATENGAISKKTTYAGQFAIDTPIFSTTGRTWFSVSCVDSNGVGSTVMYFDVLVKSRTPDNYYTMQSSDLTTYGIIPEDRKTEVALANKSALSSFFAAVKNGGYNGVVMLNHTYWLDYHGSDIVFPNEFTIDLNGSTIAAVQCTDLSEGRILKFNNNFDSHIINGSIKGNYENFDFATTATNTGRSNPSEWLHITESSKSHHCSFENLDISWAVGYEATTDGGDYGTSFPHLVMEQSGIGKRVDISNGELVDDENMIVSGFIAISNATNIAVGRTGYCSYSMGLRREYFASFYDSSKNYISSVKSKFYQQIKTPLGTAFVRISGYGANLNYWPETNAAGIVGVCKNQNHSSCIEYRNCTFHDTRTVAIQFKQGGQLAMIGCNFHDVALQGGSYQVTKLLGDIEDGWQWMQSLAIIGCTCVQGRGESSLVVKYAPNFYFKDNKGIVLTYGSKGGGVEAGFIVNNEIQSYRLDRNFRSVMPHVVYEWNTINSLSVPYSNDRGNLYTNETVYPTIAMRDSTIKSFCAYGDLYLRRTMNGSEYNE